jgi:hypothetical protein
MAKKSYLNVIFDAQPSCCLEYYLRTYAELTRSRVLASLANGGPRPAISTTQPHTLSSYGYIIMILHFLVS